MMKIYRFFYRAWVDSMPEYVYVSSETYEEAYRLFLGHLHTLQGFNPKGPLRFYDWSKKGEVDLLCSETDMPARTVCGAGELRFWKKVWA